MATNRLTLAEKPELDEVFFTHVGELCGKQAVSTGNEVERRTPLTLVRILWVHDQK